MQKYLALFFLISVWSCQNNATTNEDRSSINLSEQTTNPSDQAIIQQFNEGDIRFFRESDDMVIGIIEDILRSPVLQTAQNRLIASEKRETRSYAEGNRKKYEVRYEGNGFKLYDRAGKFLFAVSVKDNGFNIGFDETISNYYDIQFVKTSNAQIMYRGSTLGNLYYVDESVFISAFGERYYVNKNGFHSAYSIISMTRIPLEERLILITELFQMGY